MSPAVAGLTLVFTRDYNAVDATVRDKTFRVVNTHLEVKGEGLEPFIQMLQAQELVGVLATENRPVVLLGDLNSPADDVIDPATGFVPLILQLQCADFNDIWLTGGDGAGFTCCQLESLININSAYSERVDYALYRGEVLSPLGHKTRIGAELLGDDVEDKTANGLWPSDHAGVIARIRIPVTTD